MDLLSSSVPLAPRGALRRFERGRGTNLRLPTTGRSVFLHDLQIVKFLEPTLPLCRTFVVRELSAQSRIPANSHSENLSNQESLVANIRGLSLCLEGTQHSTKKSWLRSNPRTSEFFAKGTQRNYRHPSVAAEKGPAQTGPAQKHHRSDTVCHVLQTCGVAHLPFELLALGGTSVRATLGSRRVFWRAPRPAAHDAAASDGARRDHRDGTRRRPRYRRPGDLCNHTSSPTPCTSGPTDRFTSGGKRQRPSCSFQLSDRRQSVRLYISEVSVRYGAQSGQQCRCAARGRDP